MCSKRSPFLTGLPRAQLNKRESFLITWSSTYSFLVWQCSLWWVKRKTNKKILLTQAYARTEDICLQLKTDTWAWLCKCSPLGDKASERCSDLKRTHWWWTLFYFLRILKAAANMNAGSQLACIFLWQNFPAITPAFPPVARRTVKTLPRALPRKLPFIMENGRGANSRQRAVSRPCMQGDGRGTDKSEPW